MTPQELKISALTAANTSASITGNRGDRSAPTMQEILAHAKVIYGWFEQDESKVPPGFYPQNSRVGPGVGDQGLGPND